MKQSIITGGNAPRAFKKSGVWYHRCEDTGTLFCKALDQSEKVGGIHEDGRNNKEANGIRLERVKSITKPNPKVLDFGCGHGLFVDFMNRNGAQAYGYDPFVDGFKEITQGVDCVTAIEVIEHFTAPFNEFDLMFQALVSGGKCYFETSFSDWLEPDSFYIEPSVGHSTIWSHAGLDHMMKAKGFLVGEHINRNVRIYIKP